MLFPCYNNTYTDCLNRNRSTNDKITTKRANKKRAHNGLHFYKIVKDSQKIKNIHLFSSVIK